MNGKCCTACANSIIIRSRRSVLVMNKRLVWLRRSLLLLQLILTLLFGFTVLLVMEV